MADLTKSFWLYAKDAEDGPLAGWALTLNYIDENTFENAVTGELLSRTDPGEQESKKTGWHAGSFVNRRIALHGAGEER